MNSSARDRGFYKIRILDSLRIWQVNGIREIRKIPGVSRYLLLSIWSEFILMTRQSSGCRNCVNRRVRCDETRPLCKNCNRRGLECGGPREGALFFINKHPPDNRSPQQKRLRPSEDIEQSHEEIQRVQQHALTWPSEREVKHNPSLSKYNGDVQVCYLQRFWTIEDESWIENSLSDPVRYPTACFAVGTLAQAYYGKRNRQPSIVTHAKHNYGRALAALHRTLLKSDTCIFDILAASTALQRYEAIVYTTSTGWIQHAGGIARAIELSGPECFKDFPNKAILDANGFAMIQEAYHRRSKTFLALERWRDLRSNSNAQDAHFDRLQDFYARLAGLAESATSLQSDQNPVWHCEVLDEADRLLADLERWATHWITAFHFAPLEKIITRSERSIYIDSDGPVFKYFLHYPTPLAGIGMNLYRAIKLTTLEWRHRLQHLSWSSGEDRRGMCEAPSTHQLAVNVCRTLHCHFDDKGQGVHRIWYLLFCSLISYKALHCESREARWITTTLVDLGDRLGIEVARNLTSNHGIKWQTRVTSEGA